MPDDHPVCLRPMRTSDFAAIINQLNDPKVTPWLAAVAQPFDETHAALLMDHGQSEGTMLHVVEHQGQAVGCICLGATVWFWLDPTLWRTGIMKSALNRALADYFTRARPPLYATARTDNTASKALLTRLGFSCLPGIRKLFFQSEMRSFSCEDYVLSPEQWHILHPPYLTAGNLLIRPATQKDAPAIAKVFANASPLSQGADVLTFIELNRFRGPAKGLFVVIDGERQAIGAATIDAQADHKIISEFVSDGVKARHQAAVHAALEARFPMP